jgi:hypothetical protein
MAKKKFEITLVEKYTSHYIVDADSEEEAMAFVNTWMADPDNERWEMLHHEVKEL